MHVTSELIIQNVTEEDEGEYECIIIVNGGTNSAKMNLTIHGKFFFFFFILLKRKLNNLKSMI